ncbi:uncharacterized protein LOC128631117 [Ictalurus punctatus]|uniref:exodeoxyribonuclease III n=1 Tax=Ictalurus punctatus TaxID=7998 RepID=A0A9F7R821_ICTPU|nr:uncharacterized protein LOC128631117 [Ictalurus punctatus]
MLSRIYTTLRFVTWNIRGVKSTPNLPKKFANVLSNLNNLRADIAFIQETHIGPKCYKILEDETGKDWKIFFTVHSSRSKGVAILIRDKVPFEYICHDEDYSGGYIVLFCHLYGELYTLVNVYNHKSDRNVLGRLKEYLMETAEGVLVVGGDFNTVLHPRLDRRPPSSRNSRLRDKLEDFTASLNLRDSWSFLHSTDDGFTRYQNGCYSRLDMFFMAEDKIERGCKIKIQSDDISDHDPVVLKVRVQKQSQNKIPIVASMLKEFRYDPDRRPGKINGAEILSAMKSLTDSEKQRSNQLEIEYYKRFQCPITELLKIKFNLMVKNKHVPEAFKESHLSGDRHISVDYLIFSRLLAKRLSAFITPSFKRRKIPKVDTLLIMTFEICTQKIRWSFLEQSLLWNLKQIPSAPPPDFSILDCFLPEVQGSSGELRLLQPGCPFTNTILNMALTQLEDLILKTETQCRTFVCYQRQALFIDVQSSRHHRVVKIAEKFNKYSGINIKVSMEGL